MLSASELLRYSRQIALPEVGLAGQERLREARVLIVGAGGLGSPAALYLAAAGVGTIGLIDDDVVEISNLHRQILHATADIGTKKVESAADALRQLNPHTRVRVHPERLSPARAIALFPEYDLVIDGSDNYATRYAVNDACATLGQAWIYGSVERFSGQVSVFGLRGGPCYRCLFAAAPAPESTQSCEEIGVLGAVPGVVGSLQASEALKLLLGVGEPLSGRLLQLDLRHGTAQTVRFERREGCASCGAGIEQSGADGGATRAADGADDGGDTTTDIEPRELARRLDEEDTLVLLDIREPWEWSRARIGKPTLLPMNRLPSEIETFDRGRELIVYCHHGTRSNMAAEWLRAQGFRARNLVGGIDRWSREIDPTVPRY